MADLVNNHDIFWEYKNSYIGSKKADVGKL